jgi:hypothetical protein
VLLHTDYYPRGDLQLDCIEGVGEDGDATEQDSQKDSRNNSIDSIEEED